MALMGQRAFNLESLYIDESSFFVYHTATDNIILLNTIIKGHNMWASVDCYIILEELLFTFAAIIDPILTQ